MLRAEIKNLSLPEGLTNSFDFDFDFAPLGCKCKVGKLTNPNREVSFF